MNGEMMAVSDLIKAHRNRRILVVTGAGVSAASGIATFRGSDPGAIWKRDVRELGTFRYFAEDPVGSWRWYLSRFSNMEKARPNAAHTALVSLECWVRRSGGELLVVTQNIDGLHRRAGSRNLIEVHGRADRVRCPADGCPHGGVRGSLDRASFQMALFLANPALENLPRCPLCQEVLRQHVLWFDEMYDSHEDYCWRRVLAAAEESEAVLFVGTSFSVGVTDSILDEAVAHHRPVLSIDPSPTTIPGITPIAARAEEILPAVEEHLGTVSQ
jgi:NAD-dependent protein deacetylase/lipoamidase